MGSLSWILTVSKSGREYDYGIGFWGANGHDGIWHIALAQNLAKGSTQNPLFWGEKVKNYHLGYDYILAYLHKLTGVEISSLYFQILPLIIAPLIGYVVYKLVYLYTADKKASLISLMFTYFGGSMGWILGKGESAFWSTQSVSTLINPPFALSLIVLLFGLYYIMKKKYIPNSYQIITAGIIFGSLFLIKVYAGLLILGGLIIVAVYELFTTRKSYWTKLFLATFLFSLLFYIPFNKESASLVLWQPFWYLETLFAVSDRLYWPKMAEAMASYKAQGVVVKFTLAYCFAFVVFIVGNFWTRLFMFKDTFKNFKPLNKIDPIILLLWSIIILGVATPTLFVQKGTAWNSVQFIYYSLFFSSILAAISLSKFRTWVIVFIFLITIPTTIYTLKDVYIPHRPPAKLSTQELQALQYLKALPDGVVLTYPYEMAVKLGQNFTAPIPLYKYASTPYVAAYSQKPLFFEKTNLDIMDYNWHDRYSLIVKWYGETDQEKARKFLTDNNIHYIYWVKPQRALLGESQLGLYQIFENEEVVMYSTKKAF